MPVSPPSRKLNSPRRKMEGKQLVGFRRAGGRRATKSGPVKLGMTKGVALAGITKPPG